MRLDGGGADRQLRETLTCYPCVNACATVPPQFELVTQHYADTLNNVEQVSISAPAVGKCVAASVVWRRRRSVGWRRLSVHACCHDARTRYQVTVIGQSVRTATTQVRVTARAGDEQRLRASLACDYTHTARGCSQAYSLVVTGGVVAAGSTCTACSPAELNALSGIVIHKTGTCCPLLLARRCVFTHGALLALAASVQATSCRASGRLILERMRRR